MKPTYLSTTACAWLALGGAIFAEDFQLPLVASGAQQQIRASMPQSVMTSDKQPASVTKLPADLTVPLFGQFKFGPKEAPMTIVFVIDKPAGKPERLWIDANGNGDLTDDPAPDWTVSEKERDGRRFQYGSGSVMLWLVKGDAASKVCVRLYRFVGNEPSMRGNLQYYPDYARIGKVELGGKSCAAILHDEYASGDYRHPWVTLKLDLNEDGKFDFRTESFRAIHPFKVGGDTYEVAGIAANGASFQIVKSTREVTQAPPPPQAAALQPGNPAPAFEATAITGQKVSLPGSYQGKLVLLDFWATWCGPCIGELPNLVKAYETYHSKGLEVLGISLDSEAGKGTLPEFLKTKQMTWPQVCDGRGWQADVARLYSVHSIPSAFLINGTTGKVIATQGLRGTQLEKTIADALAGKLPQAKSTSGAASTMDLRHGLVAVWNANGNATDLAGQTVGILRKVAFAEGVQGQAFDFIAGDAAVVFGEATLKRDFRALSVVAWVKARTHGHADYDGFGRTLLSRTEDGGFALRVLDGRIQFDLRTEDGLVHKLLFQHPPLPLNTWVHVCVTYDGKTTRAYVNGKSADNEMPVTGRIKKTTRPSALLLIGNEPGTVPNDPAGIIQPGHFGWDGLVDQLAVYDRALSTAEISRVYARSGSASLANAGIAARSTSSNHMFEMMRAASTDHDGALKTLLDGLQSDPLKHPWALEVTMIFKSDERRALTLRGEERIKHFGICRAYLQRASALTVDALTRHPGNEMLHHGMGALDDALARASLEMGDTAEAKKIAVKLLAANTDTTTWNYGNILHDANALLGRAALREGDKPAAAGFLRKAGATPGSPQLNSFGPDFTFAREMVEAGATQAVLDYLDQVERFWAKQKSGSTSSAKLASRHKEKLDQWRMEVRSGKMPDFRP